MPCDSVICNSSDTLDTASFPTLQWSWRNPLSWLVGIANWLERRREYKQLLELDERLLVDMGLSKSTAVEARKSDLYMIAWRDSR